MSARPPFQTLTLTADLIEAFAGTFLSPRYDRPVPTPPFHREAWALYCSNAPEALVIAPRDHAKSTALTFVFILAETLFRVSDYVVLVGSTEDMAAEQLSNIREELTENEDLRAEFGIALIEQDTKTDIIVRMDDGHRFRILVRGAEQKIRGKMWKGKRPNLLVGDDMEDDEQVENKERRRKFSRWFFRAAKQALSRVGRARVHGTILHEDSLLSHLRKNENWKHLFFKAHESFDDFSNPLWPEAWPQSALRRRRQEFIAEGDSAGYSQEFLNDPRDNSEAYLRRADFLPMQESDFNAQKTIAVGWDFAISKADYANRTSCTVGGKCVNNLLHIFDQRVARLDALEIIDLMFQIEEEHSPSVHFVETGQIWRALSPIIAKEMQIRDTWFAIQEITPVADKASRARALQKRHRAKGIRFAMSADWYPAYEDELLRFTGNSEALLDDQLDSTALLVKGFEYLSEVEEEDFEPEEESEMRRHDPRRSGGRSSVTGY